PALLAARALGLGGPAFCLDAACASALYAISLACDALTRRDVDLMVAGGVNRADDLFIHVGFCALQAMSRSGQSRPFHAHADGLIPGEGAAMVTLCRLDDAIAAKVPIHGVIRAVGLANDGSGRGLLVPSAEGQARALRAAFRQSGIAPSQIQLLEAHATGTPVGDIVEVESATAIYGPGRQEPLALGSLKSNIGHTITVSGAAGLIKVLGALEHHEMPPTLHVDEPLERLKEGPLALLRETRPWPAPKDGAPRRAAVSSFGFGGNDAHLLVEAYHEKPGSRVAVPRETHASQEPIAIVDIEALVGSGRDTADFAAALFHDPKGAGRGASPIELPLTGLRFPPADLDQTLAQQLTLLRAALALVARHPDLPREETGVLVGMQCDAEVGRYGARWRVASWAESWAKDRGVDLAEDWIAHAREEIGALRTAAGVIGAMPNVVANRLCAQLDLQGPSYTVSAEEASGIVALDLACHALRRGDLTCALVGAVDLAKEPVHEAAARAVFGKDDPRAQGGDAALLLLLEPLAAAKAAGHSVLAILDDAAAGDTTHDGDTGINTPRADIALRLQTDAAHPLLGGRFGHPHAASGLVQVAAAALACAHRARPATVDGAPALPILDDPCRIETQISVLEGSTRTVTLTAPRQVRPLLLGDRRPAPRRPASPASPASRSSRAPLAGDVAFVYTGPAGAYPAMGHELLLAFPWLFDLLDTDARATVAEAGGWIMDPARQDPRAVTTIAPEEKLWGTTLLSSLHTLVARELLGLKPQAALGLSAGESNALFGLGAWNDMAAMYRDIRAAGVFDRAIAGDLEVPRRAWVDAGLLDEDTAEKAAWRGIRVLAPMDEIKAALTDEPLAHLTIIHTAKDALIAGEAEACQRVAARLGIHRCLPLGYDVAIHCPEVESYLDTWYRVHHRAVTEVPDVHFYAAGFGGAYTPTADRAAEAICAMATRTLDWPALIEQAYQDGVRVFVELGPRDGCTRWTDQILGERPHVAVALDRHGVSPLRQLIDTAETLADAGVNVDLDRLDRALERAHAESTYPRWSIDGLTRQYPSHPAPVALPPLVDDAPRPRVLPLAPALPPVAASEAFEPTAKSPTKQSLASKFNPASDRTDALTQAALAQHARLSLAHQHFLAEQARVEEAFLALRSHALAALATAAPQAANATPIATPQVDDAAPIAMSQVVDATPAVTPAIPTAATVRDDTPKPKPIVGPAWDRQDLEVLASGKISEVFGETFALQDDYPRQVRVPEAPLLLVDRVTGLDAPPGSM
ncbi:MAG: beta keto-acyl synthase, partial [Deltaproteobacteria bacterium]|nr:beta keto-acyl synthase [Deltaproteobacteria bacterium]